ncbi:MAG: tetratricopeptide repeat protein [Thermomicrobiales bacterium]
MTARRALFLVLTAIFLIAGSYAFSAGRVSGTRSEPLDSSALDDAPASSGQMGTDQLLSFWGDRVASDPHDYLSLTFLGQAFMRKGRETGDVGNYARAQAALQTALAINPSYDSALTYTAALRYTLHDFAGALDLATRMYANDPRQLQALATIGDAELELGRYADAGATYTELASKAPGPAVDSRLARLAWVRGQPDEALRLARQAVEEGEQLGLQSESIAWYHLQYGEVLFNTGQYDDAAAQYTLAGERFANYYLAFAGLGKVRAAQGRYTEAIASYEQAVAIVPQPDLLANLGDLYHLTGRDADARRQYDTVEFIAQLEAINQVIYNRQLILFRANHSREIDEAVASAQREYGVRQDVYGADALAWALYQAGRYDEAAGMSERALALGTRDALLFYHAGMIAAHQGQNARARQLLGDALALNPGFDPLQAGVARQTLAELGGQ